MNLLIASDSYKGSVSAYDAGESIKKGILRAISDADVTNVPMADGGEGTIDAILANREGRLHEVNVHDPLMHSITVSYAGITHEGKDTAIIECARSTGLPLIPEEQRNPMLLNSYGLGEQILDAVKQGYQHLIITLGGSATNDGGVGMLQALGWTFYNDRDEELPIQGNQVANVHRMSDQHRLSELDSCQITIASDVTNPFHGKNGATHVFGPQKGATPAQLETLDLALARLASVFSKQYGENIQTKPGSGAAGGLGGALYIGLQGTFEAGIDVVMDLTKLEDHIKQADLVITGEGSLDQQSLMGKVPHGVAKLAKKYKKPIIGLAGRHDLELEQLNRHLDVVLSIQTEARPMEQAIEPDFTRKQLTVTSEQLIRLYLLGRAHSTN
ncbi:glycerate kinase [Pontibacillus yanchengensis]|uniref:Glycerate kinase n=1 Tax=Pontibacillus yanchengensis Y32 TaxID=1385514 RepID=A0A0A2TIC8_9BACI|nr:glycerate kinase [Pontibacillus yanchengensis]KGP73821.1 glycerate kinase [Pontibacillus yanchengensis Y32]